MATRPHVFLDSLEELISSCISFYEKNKDKMTSQRIRENRAKLSGFVEAFHEDCGTVNPAIEKRIEDLRSDTGLVLMTAHQPNFFAYSGVFRKATLNFVLAKKLEELLNVPVVSFFGIADQDFAEDRWVRSCQLPAVRRSGGILTIDVKLPEKLMLNRVPKLPSDLLGGWKAEIEKWLDGTVRSVERLCRSLDFPKVCSTFSTSNLCENFRAFWDIVDDCYEDSENYSDFNAFIMSKIVNDIWRYDTVLARFSECQQAFIDEFCFLLSRFEDYSRLLKETKHIPCDEGMGGGVSDKEPLLVPFWYHCDCGSKSKLFLNEESGSLFGKGNCEGCGESHELELGAKGNPKISHIGSRISARAIPMSLVFFNGLLPSCYIGGIGGIRYLKEAEYIAKGLRIPFPPIAVWRPHDKYLGVAQIEAILEIKRICNDLGVQDFSTAKDSLELRISEIRQRLDTLEVSKNRIMEELKKHPEDGKLKEEIKRISMDQTKLVKSSNLSVVTNDFKILENISAALDLIPSIIDYAVNIGLEETSEQWIEYLLKYGSLSSDLHLKSSIDGLAEFDISKWLDPNLRVTK